MTATETIAAMRIAIEMRAMETSANGDIEVETKPARTSAEKGVKPLANVNAGRIASLPAMPAAEALMARRIPLDMTSIMRRPMNHAKPAASTIAVTIKGRTLVSRAITPSTPVIPAAPMPVTLGAAPNTSAAQAAPAITRSPSDILARIFRARILPDIPAHMAPRRLSI